MKKMAVALHQHRSSGVIRELATRMSARWAWVLVASTIACADPVAPADVDLHGLAQFEPPAVYLEWWKDLEVCSGTRGDYERVQWFTADSLSIDGKDALGLWGAPHDIYLIHTVKNTSWVVKHEMLHDLLRFKGRAHRSRLFDQCASGDRV